jgi:endonuclease YncB( thermonuclease family)
MRGLGIVAVGLLIALAVVLADRTWPVRPYLADVFGTSPIVVVDGDTVRSGGLTYRLVGFDTPETFNARCAGERALGERATRRLRELVALPGAVLREVTCSCRRGTHGTPACNYGRRCGTLTVSGQDVGQTLMREGLARAYICGSDRCPPRGSWC